jgi:3-hydroxyacyl-CoA dehydrogenase
MQQVQYRTENQIAILTIENPPVNALSPTVQESLRDAIARAMQDSDVDAVVLIGAGNTFVAGADIKQLERMANAGVVRSILPQVLLDMEAAPKPVVAAIHGFALGGGLEVALAAHYRIAAPEAKIGQPEVKLGIIPGSGGTQRLPRLAGVETALEMCVFGEPIRAEDAKRRGIVDRIAEKDLLNSAIQFAREVSFLGPRRTRDFVDKLGTPETNAALLAAFRERARKTRRYLLAPLAAIDAIQAATELPFEEACRKERQLFEQLLISSQAKSLIHVFFAERAAGKLPSADPSTVVFPIQSAAVVGAATMGLRGSSLICSIHQ